VIADIRKRSPVPIIVLSARADERAGVEALHLGADDYVSKPFGMAELMARVRAARR
jgi:two-component system KDP operon response regulator KdpE